MSRMPPPPPDRRSSSEPTYHGATPPPLNLIGMHQHQTSAQDEAHIAYMRAKTRETYFRMWLSIAVIAFAVLLPIVGLALFCGLAGNILNNWGVSSPSSQASPH